MSELLINSGLHPEQMKSEVDDFMDKIHELCKILHIDISSLAIDHIALRINQWPLAQAAHQAWLEYGSLLSEAKINGRPIVVLDLYQPIVHKQWSIACLELPYPAEGKCYPTQGWEHIECVFHANATTAQAYLQAILQHFPELAEHWDSLAALGVKTKLSHPQGEGERLANPTVAFKWQGVCLKLHPHSLRQVIESERLT
ncbi:VOC family protein [Vibrio sp. V31_P5A7T61]|uniref:VOC family protein n=1 Tax=Vibrio TaxID=662 RepID=UPI0013733900|nr:MULTISPECIES: VOC family protein [unclassified Vibrio]EKO3644210.1 VOC family protein [Vibrio metschnikovii]EKO3658196.1 VOC family protein [Vibrio metschnikovii]NAW63003.1 VOC family protein [Vibrio sp. V31_P5A7T61]NAX03472.1 VOC family protein [Vibrio sp. V34_P3A8T189]NAX09680.1 VOC family protein [Vibrio sp. V40_P2S30T141]